MGLWETKRAFVYIDDIIKAISLSLEKGFGQGVIQIGPDKSETIANIAKKLVKISGKDINIKFDITKPEEILTEQQIIQRQKKSLVGNQ